MRVPAEKVWIRIFFSLSPVFIDIEFIRVSGGNLNSRIPSLVGRKSFLSNASTQKPRWHLVRKRKQKSPRSTHFSFVARTRDKDHRRRFLSHLNFSQGSRNVCRHLREYSARACQLLTTSRAARVKTYTFLSLALTRKISWLPHQRQIIMAITESQTAVRRREFDS